MRVLLTGITGNLGSEIASDLTSRGIGVIPIVRPVQEGVARVLQESFEEVIENDLLSDSAIQFRGSADYIIHCAGDVRFHSTGNSNEKMTLKVIELARKLEVPVYCVSTAFVYMPPGKNGEFSNSYQKDKFQSEQVLIASGVPHAIFRPAILTGNSKTGKIKNFSGYYTVIGAFVMAVRESKKQKQKFRFPKLSGKTNMVPVDQAAGNMGDVIQSGQLGSFYVINPKAPIFSWVLEEAFDFFGVSDSVDFLDCSFEEFGKLELTSEEKKMYQFGLHFSPFWSIEYDFPSSICKENLISHDYCRKILGYFRDSQI